MYRNYGNRDMQLHFEVIRDKDMIYAELLQSKCMGNQLAICYKKDENLIVRICNVEDITRANDGVQITLKSVPNEDTNDAVIGLEKIESIYPIHAFRN